MRSPRGADARSHERLFDLPAGDRRDVPGGVDQEALRQLDGAVVAYVFPAGVTQTGVGEVVFVDELERFGGDVLVGDPEHGRVVAFQLALQPLHRGRLGLAGRAPRRPEVQHHDPPAVGGERAVAAADKERQLFGGLRREGCWPSASA